MISVPLSEETVNSTPVSLPLQIGLTLIQAGGAPLIRFDFPTLQPGEIAAMPIPDSERLAVQILDLALSTKPADDTGAMIARSHRAVTPHVPAAPATRIPAATLQKHPRAKKLLKAGQAVALFVVQDCYTGEDEDVQELLSQALALLDQAEQLIGARNP